MTTNALDGLLARVDDSALRAALVDEVDRLRETKDFGLVFERHIPETLRLYSYPVKRGAKVHHRAESDGTTWYVKRVNNGRAELVDREGNDDSRPVEDLVVVGEFGEPIYPGIKRVGRVQRGGDKPFHAVVNGENYHALQALVYLYEAQVDCIYIDPPYNTGAKDWKYNNNYVDRDDTYRHSKWLSFMEKRLELAKRLLKPAESVLIVAIDENEVHRLKLLLEEIFRGSKIQMVTVLSNPAGASIIDQFDRVDEHLLFVHVGTARPIRTTALTTPFASDYRKADDEDASRPPQKKFRSTSLLRSGGNSLRKDTKAKFFPIYIDEKKKRIQGCGDHLPEGEDRHPVGPAPRGCIQVWPIKPDGTEACWQLSAPTFREYLKAGRIRLGRKKKDGAYGMTFLTKGDMKAIADGEVIVVSTDSSGAMIVGNAPDQLRTRDGKTIWTNGSYSSREHGGTLLRSFIPGRQFPFPKSLYAVEDALRFYVGNKPDALILDFFVGSGTTTHAVARLNHQDGGRRRSVVVTNNEVSDGEAAGLRARGLQPGDVEWEALGIFEHITRPRLEAALTGRTPEGTPIVGNYRFIDESPMADGFAENVEFLELIYLDRNEVSRATAFKAIAPLLWMKVGGVGEMIAEETSPFAAPPSARYAVLFDISAWPTFAEAVRDRDDIDQVYVVTDSLAQYQQVSTELPPDVKVSMLYEDYLRNFEVTGGSAL